MGEKETILSITGSDSTGGSGIQADIKTITLLGSYAATAITSVTAQDKNGIQTIYDIPSEVLYRQINLAVKFLQPTGIKVGMLRTIDQVNVVEKVLLEYRPKYVIIDAVIISSKGNVLMPKEVITSIIAKLFPLATLVVIKQDSALYISQYSEAHGNEQLVDIAKYILSMGSNSVVLQGSTIASQSFTDILLTKADKVPYYYTRQGVIDRITHGLGGAFSSATAVYLCNGFNIQESVKYAQDYLAQLILHSTDSKFGISTQLLDHSSSMSIQNISIRKIEIYNALMNLIAINYKATREVSFYSNHLNITARYLAQVAKSIAGRTPKQLIDDYAIKEIEAELITSNRNIQEIAFSFGFHSQVQFNKFFKKMKHCSPSEFKKLQQ